MWSDTNPSRAVVGFGAYAVAHVRTGAIGERPVAGAPARARRRHPAGEPAAARAGRGVQPPVRAGLAGRRHGGGGAAGRAPHPGRGGGARAGPAAAGRGARPGPPNGWSPAIGAAPLAPVLAAAAQNRRPMSLPGLGAETGTIAVAPIMVNHDVVAHLVTVRPAAPDPVRPGAGRRPEPAAHRARGDHLRDHPGPRTGGRRGRRPGPHRADRGPAAGPGPRRRRGRALGRPPRLPARRRAPRVRGGHPGRSRRRRRERRRRTGRGCWPWPSGPSCADPGRDRRGARDRGGRGGAGAARVEGRAGRRARAGPAVPGGDRRALSRR